MSRYIFKQAFALMRQNRFYSGISILGTAVSIAFVMVVYMVYDLNTGNIAPESNRSRMIYSGSGYFYITKNHSNVNSGMSLGVAHEIFDSLPGLEIVTYMPYASMVYAGAGTSGGERQKMSYIDENFWKVYEIPLLAGRTFSREEYAANRDVTVITERVARKEFGSVEDAVGKTLFVNFIPLRVIGVTEDVNSIFTWAFSDMWRPYNPYDTGNVADCEGLKGSYTAMMLYRSGVSSNEVKEQITASVARLNERLREFTFEMNDVGTVAEKTFFGSFTPSPEGTFVLLGFILLIVPAINISGLVSSQISSRLNELGIRKTYGASNKGLVMQLLQENLVLSTIGAVIGFILSCLLVYLMKDWILGLGDVDSIRQLHLSFFLFLRPGVFFFVFIACILLNLMSVLVPAWSATRNDIITTLKGE